MSGADVILFKVLYYRWWITRDQVYGGSSWVVEHTLEAEWVEFAVNGRPLRTAVR